MRKRMANAIMSLATELEQIGLMDTETKRNIEQMMTALNVQFIETDGHRTHAILPYDEYCRLVHDEFAEGTIPAEVVQMTVLKGYSLLKAWRKYRGLKQVDLARKVGITQSALSQIEKSESPHRATLRKLSKAMSVDFSLLIDDDDDDMTKENEQC